ncbi:hypothetical protein U1Q18_015073, partial [Sarracenia purpurea var. burkii]
TRRCGGEAWGKLSPPLRVAASRSDINCSGGELLVARFSSKSKWFPTSSVIAGKPKLSRQDVTIMTKLRAGRVKPKEDVKQQGEFESIHRDLMVGFGSWEFDPMDLEKPFLDNEGSVHLWQGDEDGLVAVTLQRYIARRLPWIHYHEISEAGHMFLFADGMKEAILKTFLLGEK